MSVIEDSRETWKAIPGYEGYYEVSDLGRVRSLARTVARAGGTSLPVRAKMLVARPRIHVEYLSVRLSRGDRGRSFQVHRLVLLAFVGPAPDGMECCHNDGNPANNRLDNLRWDTRLANCQDRIRHGTTNRKTHCLRGHAFDEANTYVYPNGRDRGCRACLALKRTHPVAAV